MSLYGIGAALVGLLMIQPVLAVFESAYYEVARVLVGLS